MKYNICSLLLGSFSQVLVYSFGTDTMRRCQSQSLVAGVGLNRPVQVPILGGGKPILITVPTTVTHPGSSGGNSPLSSRSPRLSILFCLLWVTLSAICHPGFASSFSCLFFLFQWNSRSLSWMTSSDCKLGMLGFDRLTKMQSSGHVCGRVSEVKMNRAVLCLWGGYNAMCWGSRGESELSTGTHLCPLSTEVMWTAASGSSHDIFQPWRKESLGTMS